MDACTEVIEMKKSSCLKLLRGLYGGFLVASLFLGCYSAQAETGQAAAVQVMNNYLESLANGDAQQLSGLIDGAMKKRSRQLSLEPDYYGEFLRSHYSGVRMSVESVRGKGELVEVEVRFEYPTSKATTIIFVLSQVEGAWKITDEIF
jgi:hypothetical protein